MAAINLLPHLTEKSLSLAKQGKYTFLVDGKTSSLFIAEEVAKLYHVHPTAVSIIKNAPRLKGTGRTLRIRPAKVKALVTVKKGEKIADFAVEEKKK